MPKKRYANSMKGMQAVHFVQALVFAGNTEELPANSIPVSRSFLCPKSGHALQTDKNNGQIAASIWERLLSCITHFPLLYFSIDTRNTEAFLCFGPVPSRNREQENEKRNAGAFIKSSAVDFGTFHVQHYSSAF